MNALCQKIKEKKSELGITTSQLSMLSGVPVGTINKILNGETRSPRYQTLKALEDALFASSTASHTVPSDRICETAPVYSTNLKKQGEYTLEDYYALPDDVRAELIDGELIYLEAPSVIHQQLISELLFEIKLYIRTNNGKCIVLPAPLDVQLDCDDHTMVQPDISVLCHPDRILDKGIYGAPDFCIEIVSPSSRKKDYSKKVIKYMDAGVREYWIVDPKRETVLCYFFEGEDYPELFTFADTIPVHIYEGNLQISFADIKSRL